MTQVITTQQPDDAYGQRLTQFIAVNAYLNNFSMDRDSGLGALASTLYGGSRDIYRIMGYPSILQFSDYLGRYERHELATRIVTAAPDDTWRKPPVIKEGMTKEDAKDDTAFAKAFSKLAADNDFDGDLLDDSRSLWHHFHQVDLLCNLGRYAVLVLGFSNGALNEMVKQGQGGELLYINALHEGQALISPSSIDQDTSSKRFGLPTYYDIDFQTGRGTQQVHYTRVLHISNGVGLFGKPILQNVYNRLIDIEKLLSATGEAGWRSISRKVIVSTRDGYKLGEATVPVALISDMINGFRDVVGVEGADVNVVSGELQDPTGPVSVQVDMIAAGTGIPQRKLLGSERGELASSQDDDNWNDLVAARRTRFAEPVIVRSFIRRMIYAGLLPKPKGVYVDWPSLYELSDTEQSAVASSYATTLTQLATPGVERVVDIPVFIRTFMRGLPYDAVPDEVEMLEEETALDDGEDDNDSAIS